MSIQHSQSAPSQRTGSFGGFCGSIFGGFFAEIFEFPTAAADFALLPLAIVPLLIPFRIGALRSSQFLY